MGWSPYVRIAINIVIAGGGCDGDDDDDDDATWQLPRIIRLAPNVIFTRFTRPNSYGPVFSHDSSLFSADCIDFTCHTSKVPSDNY